MKKIVALAVSGGIDSAISAYLLQEMGYEVVGVHFHFWKWEKDISSLEKLKRILIDDISEKIGFRIETIKQESYFKKTIVNEFLSEFGKTRGELRAMQDYQYKEYIERISDDKEFLPEVGMTRGELDAMHEQQYNEYENRISRHDEFLPEFGTSRGELQAMQERQYKEIKNRQKSEARM